MINTERIVEIGYQLKGIERTLNQCLTFDYWESTPKERDRDIAELMSEMIALWLEYYELTKNHYSLTCGTVH